MGIFLSLQVLYSVLKCVVKYALKYKFKYFGVVKVIRKMKLYERIKESQLLRLKNLVSIVNSNVNER